MTRYKRIQARARYLGINTIMDRGMKPHGYWIVDSEGEGVWPDDNFAMNLTELEHKLDRYEEQVRS